MVIIKWAWQVVNSDGTGLDFGVEDTFIEALTRLKIQHINTGGEHEDNIPNTLYSIVPVRVVQQ